MSLFHNYISTNVESDNPPSKAGDNNSRHTNKLRKARLKFEWMESQDSSLVHNQKYNIHKYINNTKEFELNNAKYEQREVEMT